MILFLCFFSLVLVLIEKIVSSTKDSASPHSKITGVHENVSIIPLCMVFSVLFMVFGNTLKQSLSFLIIIILASKALQCNNGTSALG